MRGLKKPVQTCKRSNATNDNKRQHLTPDLPELQIINTIYDFKICLHSNSNHFNLTKANDAPILEGTPPLLQQERVKNKFIATEM